MSHERSAPAMQPRLASHDSLRFPPIPSDSLGFPLILFQFFPAQAEPRLSSPPPPSTRRLSSSWRWCLHARTPPPSTAPWHARTPPPSTPPSTASFRSPFHGPFHTPFHGPFPQPPSALPLPQPPFRSLGPHSPPSQPKFHSTFARHPPTADRAVLSVCMQLPAREGAAAPASSLDTTHHDPRK